MTDETTISPEIEAMSRIENILSGLDDETRSRVLRWTAERFKRKGEPILPTGSITGGQDINLNLGLYKELADFFSDAQPETEAEKALVVGYWFQIINGEVELDAQRINTELKNLGHQVSNITRALDSMKDSKPQLIVQTKKTGTAKQARKRYKLTTEGKKAVEAMLNRINEIE
jgi:hypothetical protein